MPTLPRLRDNLALCAAADKSYLCDYRMPLGFELSHPATTVPLGAVLAIPPATITEVPDELTMRTPTPLAAPSSPSEPKRVSRD